MQHDALVLLLVAACASPADAGPGQGPVDASVEPPPVTVDAGMVPLAGDWIEPLSLPGGAGAWVMPPVGATEPRPVVVAVHGAMSDSGEHCSTWRVIVDAYAFVVCPSGTKIRKYVYVWSSSQAIDDGIDASLAALKARYGAYVAEGPPIYAAFSQGANLAGPVLTRKTGPHFARAMLTEGGYRALETATAARAFGTAGGGRVLFTCSQPGCAMGFSASSATLEREGIPARVVYAGNHGHGMPPAVRTAINEALPWLVDGLPGWGSYASYPKLPSH